MSAWDQYITSEIFTIDEIRERYKEFVRLGVISGSGKKIASNIPTNGLGGTRVQTFLVKGVACVKCHLEGSFFALQRMKSSQPFKLHYNLWSHKNNSFILMTRDHIIPECKGGSNYIENSQCMCSPCNAKKNDKIPKNVEIRIGANGKMVPVYPRT